MRYINTITITIKVNLYYNLARVYTAMCHHQAKCINSQLLCIINQLIHLAELGIISFNIMKHLHILKSTPLYFQEAATNALLAMTSVLKAESSAGESYEVLFDGARSLVTGLGSMLRVSSYGAKVYDSESQDVASAQGALMFRRRRGLGKETSSLSDFLTKRQKRRTDYDDAQEKVIRSLSR